MGNLQKRLLGQQDPRGAIGIFSRGKNVYNSSGSSAHSGGGSQFGRPKKNDNSLQDAITRRLNRKGGKNAFIG